MRLIHQFLLYCGLQYCCAAGLRNHVMKENILETFQDQNTNGEPGEPSETEINKTPENVTLLATTQQPLQKISGTLLSLDFVPECMRNCSLEYLETLETLYVKGAVEEIVPTMCNNLNSTISCLHESCDSPANLQLSLSALSGIQYSCEQRHVFEAIIPCAEAYADLDKNCAHCGLYASALSLVQSAEMQSVMASGGSAYEALALAGDVCGNATCSLFCIRENMDEHCLRSGAKLTEVFLRPLSRLYTALIESDMKSVIVQQMPKQCKALMSKETLKSLFFDDIFRKDLFNWIQERRDKDILAHHVYFTTTPGPEGASLSAYLVQMEKPFFLVFIPTVMLLNLVALVISVMWCLRTRNSVQHEDEFNASRSPNKRFFRLRKGMSSKNQ